MNPSPTELTLLKQLWMQEKMSARELHQAVEAELNWSYSSTRKTIERMQQKGLVQASQSHGLNVYKAKARKLPTIAAMIRRFASEVLGMSGPLPVSNLVDSSLLNDEELAHLEQLLANTPSTHEDEPA